MISIAPFREDAADPIVHAPRADRQICFVGAALRLRKH
jgi:hypothetical protein